VVGRAAFKSLAIDNTILQYKVHALQRPYHMATHFYCWEPSLWLAPLDRDPVAQINAYYRLKPPVKPSDRLLTFVDELLSHFPDFSKGGEDVIWAGLPLQDYIIGQFVDLAVSWYYYEDARPVVIATATAHGLRCFDPNEGQIYPVRLMANQ
jgi:hypothetical protein